MVVGLGKTTGARAGAALTWKQGRMHLLWPVHQEVSVAGLSLTDRACLPLIVLS